MAPEVLEQKLDLISGLSDIYSLGKTFYQMILHLEFSTEHDSCKDYDDVKTLLTLKSLNLTQNDKLTRQEDKQKISELLVGMMLRDVTQRYNSEKVRNEILKI